MSSGPYLVLHNYHTEGWKIVGTYDTLRHAAEAREDDIATAGGEVIVVEVQPLSQVYGHIGCEREYCCNKKVAK